MIFLWILTEVSIDQSKIDSNSNLGTTCKYVKLAAGARQYST